MQRFSMSYPLEVETGLASNPWNQRLRDILDTRRAQNRYRQRKVLQSPQGSHVQVDGKDMLAFCSNDYLALANHPRVVEAFQKAADRYGVGSGASHLVCGHGEEHHRLEEKLAAATGRDRAVLISTGYMANFGVINALADARSSVFMDRLNHASLLDGGFICRGTLHKFPHNDVGALSSQLAACEQDYKLIAVDGIYSMDGDLAPLPELAQLARDHGAALMVDDAHGFGWLGSTGAGVCEHFGLDQEDVPILMATLGKSLGSFGAFVAGSEELIEVLIQTCRPYIFSTALPPAVAAASSAALDVIHDEPERRSNLNQLILHFRAEAKARGIPVQESETPVQPVVLGSESRTMAVAEFLAQRGIWVGAIRPPSVPEASSRLRISLNASHTKGQVERLLDAVAEALEFCR